MEAKIRSFIVEDEKKSRETLIKMLKEFCPEVEVVGSAATVDVAVSEIKRLDPELVFLDIALPDGDGFAVLENFHSPNFDVIFVTAYDKYAIRAFEFAALHYLLKPIDHTELQKGVRRFIGKSSFGQMSKNIELLNGNFRQNRNKIMVPTTDGLEVISLDEVLYFEADHNYTNCYMQSNRHFIVSRSLINFEALLSDLNFVRVHNKYLVNLKYVKKYMRGHGGSILMSNGTEISVSKNRKAEFLSQLEDFARKL